MTKHDAGPTQAWATQANAVHAKSNLEVINSHVSGQKIKINHSSHLQKKLSRKH